MASRKYSAASGDYQDNGMPGGLESFYREAVQTSPYWDDMSREERANAREEFAETFVPGGRGIEDWLDEMGLDYYDLTPEWWAGWRSWAGYGKS